jgi:DNA repair exonuclease SbcCD ATPase subunit/UDP-2,3-diacylglucosamine pyrophosphatase LpxH
MITILKADIQRFTHILQIADVHIRLNKRHEEYRNVFKSLYEEVKNSPPDTVVAILGDVFHSKSELSPECIQMATDLFKNLADLRPVILVAGNHDATLSNKSRLDSLTPLVDSLSHPNLYYLRNTGLYGFGNILWNNMGVFDQPENYIRGQDIPNLYRNQYEHIIALFHGAVDKAALETGYSISNPAIMTPLFDWHDIALLGDIHKKQDMQDYAPDEYKPCVHYVGSMIQQNHGEELKGHGYSLWDLNTRHYEFHELKNEVGYFTVDIHKGQVTTDLSELPTHVHLRLKCFETIASEVKSIIAKIKERCQIIEISYVRMDQETEKKDVIPLCTDVVLTDLTSVEYQNKLIKEFLKKKLQITDPLKTEDILKINRITNLLIKKDEFARNLRWKPIRFEWDNMFTYGEGNSIDFTQMDGVYGIFAPNRAGKSSILSAIIFCLFDKFDRGFKGMHVLNVQKSSFSCKLEFEIDEIRYFIERKGSTTRSGNVKVDVRFWKINNGVEEELHGTARRDTNDIIRDYIGTYENFMLTAASFQTAKNNMSFIDMGNCERKDLLVQFIGLNVFDRLAETAGERSKELNTLLKLHKDKNYSFEKNQNESALSHADTLFNQATRDMDYLKKQVDGVNEQIVIETENLIKLNDDVPTDIIQLNDQKTVAETSVRKKKVELEEFKKLIIEKEKNVAEINHKIQKIESSNLVESHKTYKILTDRINEIKQSINLKKVEVKQKIEKVERLKNHEYDPNCRYCINNSFVKDATQAQAELIKDKQDTDHMVSALENLRVEYAKFQWVEKSYETYTKLLNDLSKVKDEGGILSRNIIIATNYLEKLESVLKTVTHQIELYHRNETSVENNTKVQTKIVSYRQALTRLNIDIQKQNKVLMDLTGKRELFRNNIERLDKTMQELVKMEYEFDSYQLYISSVGRDGIPYQVICNTVPEIEKEINSILCQVVDYTIQLETDGKNVVPYVVYDFGKWPIELTSGFERFVASIAIRVALTNVSNLPRCNFCAVDEGFGTLDSDNLASMYTLFSFLKSNFDFILVISHLDTMKDAVDKSIEIKKDGSFSKVIFE